MCLLCRILLQSEALLPGHQNGNWTLLTIYTIYMKYCWNGFPKSLEPWGLSVQWYIRRHTLSFSPFILFYKLVVEVASHLVIIFILICILQSELILPSYFLYILFSRANKTLALCLFLSCLLSCTECGIRFITTNPSDNTNENGMMAGSESKQVPFFPPV